MGSFKDINVDLGLFLAFFTGVITIIALSFGILSWLDNRISDNIISRIYPLEQRIDRLEIKFEEYDSARRRENRQIIELIKEAQQR